MRNLQRCRPWSSHRIEKGDDGRDVNSTPLRNLNFRNQNGHWNHQAVEDKGDNVGYDLPNKEEAVDHMNLLPQSHFLESK